MAGESENEEGERRKGEGERSKRKSTLLRTNVPFLFISCKSNTDTHSLDRCIYTPCWTRVHRRSHPALHDEDTTTAPHLKKYLKKEEIQIFNYH
jgi:hypothetical protein